MKTVECMASEFFETLENEYDGHDAFTHRKQFLYFTVGNGKARYKLMHLPDNGCGLHYAFRVAEDGVLEGRRPLEPTQKIYMYFYEHYD